MTYIISGYWLGKKTTCVLLLESVKCLMQQLSEWHQPQLHNLLEQLQLYKE